MTTLLVLLASVAVLSCMTFFAISIVWTFKIVRSASDAYKGTKEQLDTKKTIFLWSNDKR